MATKFRAKFGALEVECEGDEAFLKSEFTSIVSRIVEAAKSLPESVLSRPVTSSSGGAGGAVEGLDLTTNTIASLTDAKTGPDLALAAAAHLTLVKTQDKFTRKELLSEMQGATTFYNQNYSGNLSKILSNLTKGKRLNLVGNNTYALPRGVREEYATRLAQTG